jgi:hypothetical protein
MTRIPSDLARFGLKVELVPGWETRGSSSFAPACVVDHWTAGPRGTSSRPSLNVVINGRPGLDGPLCNVYLARDGTCVVVAAGRANHAGAGGFRGLVGNSAAYGIEAECGGDGDWTPAMLLAYPRLNAALLSGLDRDASWVAGHNNWAPDRKIDIRDIIDSVRAQTAAVLGNPSEEFTVAQYDEIMTALSNIRDDGWKQHSDSQTVRAAYHREVMGVLVGNNEPGQTNFHWLAKQIVAAAAPGAQVEVVEDAIAKAVADEIDRRERERLDHTPVA